MTTPQIAYLDNPAAAACKRAALAQWDDLLDKTNAMLQAAKVGDWERVRSLEGVRRPILMAMLDHPVAEEHATAIADNLEDILNMDAEVMALGQTQMDHIESRLLRLNKGQQAANAYRR